MRASRLLFVAVACAAALARPAYALDIALTNDDGWSALGIQVMRTALQAAGHNVTLAAPLTDQSGSSMSFDFAPLLVKKQAEGQYSVALWPDGIVPAKPANAGLVAIGIAEESGRFPDLLISGINTNAPIGVAALQSGTVGAAVYAILPVANGPLPAIAVGTDEPNCDTACKEAHYAVVADFVVRFVAHLQTKPGFLASEPRLLPAGVGLIISYPTADVIEGVKIAVQSDAILASGQKVSGVMSCAGTGCSGLAVNSTQRARLVIAADDSPEIKDSDLSFYTAGYATIVPIVGDLTAFSPHKFKSALAGFAP